MYCLEDFMGIEIKNFSYKYPLEDKNVLENLNLKREKQHLVKNITSNQKKKIKRKKMFR